MQNKPTILGAQNALQVISKVALESPLQYNERLSNSFSSSVYLKREDQQQVRSFKIRGAFNKINSLSKSELQKGIVCASAGNHAQGFAFSCNQLKILGTVFMPIPTPSQKIEQVKMFGGPYVSIVLGGDTYDDSQKAALEHCKKHKQVFVHPFDDVDVIEGQGTIAIEMIKQAEKPLDYIFVPIGGGGLISGILTVFKVLSPKTKVIGVEPLGAPSMKISLKNHKNTRLKKIDKFVDGAAVQRVGDLSFEICQNLLDDCITVDEGRICQEILDLYNKEGIVAEPAGALAIAGIDQYAPKIKGKQVAAILCGGNNDITRTPEIEERALLHAQLKHYFIVRFPQRAGALKDFVTNVLGPEDDITYFEFTKKSNQHFAPAVLGVELKKAQDFDSLLDRMKTQGFFSEYLNDKPDLFKFLKN
ncbi:MAG: threonine ammonia-lyase IlvA [Flavobacteriaceae bacterium]